MSHKLIDHSPDIKKLRNEGYEVEIIGNYLLIHSIPYLNSEKMQALGTLVTNVSIANNSVVKPNTHVIHFKGEFPCNIDGKIIDQLKHASNKKILTEGVVVDYSFSNKPATGYSDYYHKVTQYVKIISAPARYFDKNVTAQTYKKIQVDEEHSVLNYSDTNSSKAEIDFVNQKLKELKIGVIGLGGTGSYILDLVAKTLVREIHLFDGDDFLQHNAFRAPGAPSQEDLQEAISKVEYFKRIYSKMHNQITTHELFLNEANVGLLKGLDFVFVCIDKSEVKKCIFKKLEDLNIPFIDTGIGVSRVEDSLLGMVRTTTSLNGNRSHVWNGRISFAEDEDGDYSSNIQIAEINSLNAALAVIKWKKLFGFYNDLEGELHSTYSINVNHLQNNDSPT
ncbi:ThiF family adenylyltransferase [Flavobacterium rakeshii]|uniref:ThiF family adenylyltransferase n=1 Tax=Flavobacterium rakeshii TaxID=1038845 RepID=UPI002E7C4F69|nr:ThiF family adenylyltransferase [Flavobacterium rakeshii]MEE1899561.1 ThiF family adenylyltransferase [Flavobacterium rakeshii]